MFYLASLAPCCSSPLEYKDNKVLCSTCGKQYDELPKEFMLLEIISIVPTLPALNQTDIAEVSMERESHETDQTICGVLKDVYSKLEEEELKQKIRKATIFAKKMSQALVRNKERNITS